MFTPLITVITFLGQLFFMKGALEPLVVYLSGKALAKYTPYILNKIDEDNLVIKWLQKYTGQEVVEQLSTLIPQVVSEVDAEVKLSPTDVEALISNVVSTYSFVVNASKLNKP